MASACAACQQPLVLTIDDSDEDEDVEMGGSSGAAAPSTSKEVPDDIGLSCGCHFHWYNQFSSQTKKE